MARFFLFAPLFLGPWVALAWIVTVALAWFLFAILALMVVGALWAAFLLASGLTPREIRGRIPGMPDILPLTSAQKTMSILSQPCCFSFSSHVAEAHPATAFIPLGLFAWFVVRVSRGALASRAKAGRLTARRSS